MNYETWEPEEPPQPLPELDASVIPSKQAQPEYNLMVAIIQDAVESLLNSDDELNFKDARQYLLGRDDTWLFSFTSICNHLDLDPDYMRQGIFKRYFEKVFKQA